MYYKMKKLLFANEEFEAERIVKTNDSVIGFTNSKKVFEFRGVSDFNRFILSDGQDFDVQELSLEDQVNFLKVKNEELATTLDLILTEVIPNLQGGG